MAWPTDLPVPLTDGVTLRRAVRDDVPGIVALLVDDPLGSGRDGGDPAPYLAAFDRIDADPAELLVVVDDGSGPVVGTAQLSLLPGLARRGTLRAQVEAVRIAARRQGRGDGTALLRWLEAEAVRQGCGLVQLTSDASRTDAHRFYERLGYAASHVGFKKVLAEVPA